MAAATQNLYCIYTNGYETFKGIGAWDLYHCEDAPTLNFDDNDCKQFDRFIESLEDTEVLEEVIAKADTKAADTEVLEEVIAKADTKAADTKEIEEEIFKTMAKTDENKNAKTKAQAKKEKGEGGV